MPNLLELPAEIRLRIYEFCFPPAGAQVQLIPYSPSSPACHLKLPISLYLVCKAINIELSPLPDKLRSLDFLYTILAAWISGYSVGLDCSDDHDPHLSHFRDILQFAIRVRLVGEAAYLEGPWSYTRYGEDLNQKIELHALRVLEIEVQSIWRMPKMARLQMWHALVPIIQYPNYAVALEEIHWVRNGEGEGLSGHMADELEAAMLDYYYGY